MSRSSKNYKMRGMDAINWILKPLRLRIIPDIWKWRNWSSQRKDVLTQLDITLAFDIGACTGQWYREFRNDGFTCPVISFECDPRALDELNASSASDPKWSVLPYALSAETGTSSFYQWPLQSGQSSLKAVSQEGSYFETVENIAINKTTVETRRFDELIKSEDLSGARCLLKIDVQGAERGVLEGVGELLQEFSAIEIEVALCDFYEANDMIEDIIGYLRLKGFIPMTIQTERWGGNNGTLAGGLDCDVLLVNRRLLERK